MNGETIDATHRGFKRMILSQLTHLKKCEFNIALSRQIQSFSSHDKNYESFFVGKTNYTSCVPRTLHTHRGREIPHV